MGKKAGITAALNPIAGAQALGLDKLMGGKLFGGGGSAGPQYDFGRVDQSQAVQQRTEPARQASLQLMNDLQKQAQGQGPSIAEAQLKAASSRNLAQTLAAAAAQRGGNPALMQRQILQQQGDAARGLAEQSAILRMQEQQQARQELANLAVQQQQQDLQQVISPAQLVSQGEADRFAADVARRNMVKQEQMGFRSPQAIGSVVGSIGQLAAASDERMKKDVKPASKKMKSFLDALDSKSYKYKNDKEPGTRPGKNFGIMAQDLEKSEVGKTMVMDVGGKKMVDMQKGFGAVLAAQAELNKRINALEKKKKG